MALVVRAFCKRTTTISLAMQFNRDGVGVNLDGVTVTSSIRNEDGDVFALTPSLYDQTTQPGHLALTATAEESADWPAGTYQSDVRFVFDNGDETTTTINSDTYLIIVQEPQTFEVSP